MNVLNDKSLYALARTFEEMCKDEKFSISVYGYEEDLEHITPESLYNHYKEILRSSPIDIVVEGDFNEEEVVNIIRKKFIFDSILSNFLVLMIGSMKFIISNVIGRLSK